MLHGDSNKELFKRMFKGIEEGDKDALALVDGSCDKQLYADMKTHQIVPAMVRQNPAHRNHVVAVRNGAGNHVVAVRNGAAAVAAHQERVEAASEHRAAAHCQQARVAAAQAQAQAAAVR